MLLSRAELEKKIADYREKADKAYMNYQDTGYARYYKTKEENEKMADTLAAYMYAEESIRSARVIRTKLSAWVDEVENINEMPADDKMWEKVRFLMKDISDAKEMLKLI